VSDRRFALRRRHASLVSRVLSAALHFSRKIFPGILKILNILTKIDREKVRSKAGGIARRTLSQRRCGWRVIDPLREHR
jgi:hypothetical protein